MLIVDNHPSLGITVTYFGSIKGISFPKLACYPQGRTKIYPIFQFLSILAVFSTFYTHCAVDKNSPIINIYTPL